MRHITTIITLLLLISASSLPAQTNLVLNPSFEDTLCCPPDRVHITCAQHWYQPNSGGSSTDFFHPCNTSDWQDFVINKDWIFPRTGNAYAHIALYGPPLHSREYLCGELAVPLKVGECYNVKFYVSSVKYYHHYATNGADRIGIKFSQNSFFSTQTDLEPMIFDPTIEHVAGVICDFNKWVPVTGSFYATGGENHFIIGNFYLDSLTTVAACNNGPPFVVKWAGIVLDDVSVWPCDAPVYAADAGRDKQICYGDEVILGQNLPDDEYRFLWSTTSHRLTPKDQWDTLATTPYLSVKPEQTTTYYLWVRDFKMDITYDSVTVFVEPCITPPEIPNVFTPNGDGFNDLFAFKNHELWELETCIRNRWGQVVFEGQNDNWWDGTIQGQPAAEGVYFYVVTARNHFGQYKEFHGVVTLLR